MRKLAKQFLGHSIFIITQRLLIIFISGAVGGGDDKKDDEEATAKDEEAAQALADQRREEEEARREKHRQAEEEREAMRAQIRKKVITQMKLEVLNIDSLYGLEFFWSYQFNLITYATDTNS